MNEIMKNKYKVLLVVAALGVVAISSGIYMFNKKVQGLEHVTPDYQLGAAELYRAFEADEATSMDLYEGKVIDVEGEVMKVELNENGFSNVILNVPESLMGAVNCSFNGPVEGLVKGQKVTVRGRCQGFLADVILNNCYIVTP